MKAKVLRIYMMMMLGLSLFLLVILVAFEIFPITNGNDDLVIMQQANFQLARNEFLAKDVLILAYRPATNHSQAINELQTVLPMFQQVQTGLLHGDASLGLPRNPPDSVQLELSVTQSDYLAMTTALKSILAHPDSPPDPVQVNIALTHEQPYVAEMYQVVSLLQQDAEAKRIQLLIIKMSLAGAVGLVVILKYALFTRGAVDKIVALEEHPSRKESADANAR